MKAVRVLLALPGLAALAWGAVLFAEYALPLRPDVYGTVTWLVGGPIVNDAVIAPLTALLGITLARRLPPRWRTPVTAGTVITATLAILAFPLLWRPYGTPPMPGLHDTDPTPGLALTVAAVWLTVVLTALTRRVVPPITRDTPPITPDPPPITRDTPPITPGPALITPGPAPGTTADPPGTQPDRPGTQPDRPGTQPDRPGTPTDPPGT